MAHLIYYNHLKDLHDVFYDSHVSLIEKMCLELKCLERKEEFIEKLLDSTLKLKPKKDLTAPKKWKSNFIIFSDQNREKIMNETPNLKLGEVAKKLGELWKDLSSTEKEKYNELSRLDKERYIVEKEEHNNKLHFDDLLQYDSKES
tara:strand:+ start:2146 stop:2583 length:438 start_codon:yes stop_codon:yes gene_type:complete